MSLTLPTRDGQGLGAFIDELRRAADVLRMRAPDPSDAWVSVSYDDVTDADLIACVHGGRLSDSLTYRIPYTRDDAGRIALGEPVEVRAVVTFEPVASPPLTMARAVCLESLPVHAPPADGLTRGKPVQILRLGALYDARTGDHLLDVTDALCADIAASASAIGLACPIDMGHALAYDGDGADLYGRIVEVEARPGSGLWGVPEWTAAGTALLSASPGLYYLSPTLLGAPRDPRTGEAMPGRLMHSVSLTATPRQDRIQSLALGRRNPGASGPTTDGGLMAGTPGAPAPNQGETVTLARAEHEALTLARTELATVKAERDALKLASEASAAETLTLSQRLAAVETERAAEKLARQVDDEIAAAAKAGRVVPATLRPVLLSATPEHRALVLGAIPVTRPGAPVGVPGAAEADPAVAAQAEFDARIASQRAVMKGGAA